MCDWWLTILSPDDEENLGRALLAIPEQQPNPGSDIGHLTVS